QQPRSVAVVDELTRPGGQRADLGHRPRGDPDVDQARSAEVRAAQQPARHGGTIRSSRSTRSVSTPGSGASPRGSRRTGAATGTGPSAVPTAQPFPARTAATDGPEGGSGDGSVAATTSAIETSCS